MIDLKVNKKFPHHYLIGVEAQSAKSKTPGKLYLKYGPIYFTNEDIKRVKNSIILINDKIYTDIYSMSVSKIYQLNNCSELMMSLAGVKVAADINSATIHHFSVEIEIPNSEQYFTSFVDRANNPKSVERKQLNESRCKI